jgi:anti-sigma B factor antagonist
MERFQRAGCTATFEVSAGEAVLSLAGEFDMAEAAAIQLRIERLLAEYDRVCLDLSGLEFLDSAGARVLATATRMAAEGGVELRTTGARADVARVLGFTGLIAPVMGWRDAR